MRTVFSFAIDGIEAGRISLEGVRTMRDCYKNARERANSAGFEILDPDQEEFETRKLPKRQHRLSVYDFHTSESMEDE